MDDKAIDYGGVPRNKESVPRTSSYTKRMEQGSPDVSATVVGQDTTPQNAENDVQVSACRILRMSKLMNMMVLLATKTAVQGQEAIPKEWSKAPLVFVPLLLGKILPLGLQRSTNVSFCVEALRMRRQNIMMALFATKILVQGQGHCCPTVGAV